ncbi:hypothetical protein [Pseudonocardia thermophila]|uniref:hypothetical protein n=1 Tax=Pseudonocardia thermophila TaxID=1848 RepID=UPI00116139B7|nr:hypothetical protein [Pseudonocardia thermophila]
MGRIARPRCRYRRAARAPRLRVTVLDVDPPSPGLAGRRPVRRPGRLVPRAAVLAVLRET